MKSSTKIDYNRDALYFSLTNDFQALLTTRSELTKAINLRKSNESPHDSLQKEEEAKLEINFEEEMIKIESKMTEVKANFRIYMEDHLSKFKDDPRDLNRIHFSGKIGSELIAIIKKTAEELVLPWLKEGKNIYVNRPQNLSSTWQEELNKIESSIPSKPPAQVSPSVPPPSAVPLPPPPPPPPPPEEEFLFKPDQIEKFEIVSLLDSSICFEITPPDDNGGKITQYNLQMKQEGGDKYLKFFSSATAQFELPFDRIPFLPQRRKIFLNLSITAQNSEGESPPLLIRLLFRLPRHSTLLVLGDNKFNRLGLGEEVERSDDLQPITLFPSCVNKVASSSSSLVLLDSGFFAQCGLSIEASELDVKEEDYDSKIETIPSIFFHPMEKMTVHDIACGRDFCLVATIDIFFKSVVAGDYHALGLTMEGEVYSWGRWQAVGGVPIKNRFEEVIGFGNCRENQLQPRKVDLYGEKIKRIYAGVDFSLALTTDSSQLYSWGCYSFGQLGHLDIEYDLATPRRIEFGGEEQKGEMDKCEKVRVIKARVGGRTVYVLAEEGVRKEIWGWGDNKDGQLVQSKNETIIKTPRVLMSGEGLDWIAAGTKGALMGGENRKLEGFGQGKEVMGMIEGKKGKVVGGRKCWWVLEASEVKEEEDNKLDV